ncbi:MAG TPA: amino acid ABC transporter permease [Xanthobacteraceae bacterium]|jgi:general L-amino acid transport system permease protein|nr:amino acid ABC transporter permease [Xanthobacteraceae bacterium]
MAEIAKASARPRRARWLDARQLGSIATQLALLAVVGGLFYAAAVNAARNLAAAHIASGFGFWNNTAGFDISQTLIAYSSSTSTFGRAFWVGLLNTLLVASIAIVFATVLGFTIGIARLSRNWLVSHLAGGYVELIRNVPLLLQLLFWYNAVLKSLPELHGSMTLPGGGFFNNRGLFLPRPQFGESFRFALIVFLLGLIATLVLGLWARRRQDRTGERFQIRWIALGLIVVVPALVFAASGSPLSFSFPNLGRFNVQGGVEILPEFAALLFALSIYTAAFIAEVVRAGLLAVPQGQTEAAQALGLPPGATLRRIVIPQAMRVIVPPLTSQYLNLIKNSSLAVAIGYPDLVQVFTGSVLFITGQAVEIVAVTMAVYLAISLCTSLLMNWYGHAVGIVER